MLGSFPLLLAQAGESPDPSPWWFVVIVAFIIAMMLAAAVIFVYGKLWFQAYMSGADVTILSLVGMGLRQVKSHVIVNSKIMATQAGLSIHGETGIATSRLEAHFLAGGDVRGVIHAIVAAHRAGIDLDFDRSDACRRGNLYQANGASSA